MMDWHLNLVLLVVLIPYTYSWNPIPSDRKFFIEQQQQQQSRKTNERSPYLDLLMCPIHEVPWSCVRKKSSHLMDIWDKELYKQWQKLKVEADQQLNSTLEKRGYSDSITLSKEKPSTILKKIEIGTTYMKKYLAETMDGFLGREYEYLQNNKNDYTSQDENNEEEPVEKYDETEDDDEEKEEEGDDKANEQTDENSNNFVNDNDNDAEFIEITAESGANVQHNYNENNNDDTVQRLKKPGSGNKNKKKKKKGSQHHDLGTQATNLLVIQPLEQQLVPQHHDGHFDVPSTTHILKPIVSSNFKPLKQKKRKKKKGGHSHGGHGGHGGHGDGDTATIAVEEEPISDHWALGLLEELIDLDVDDGGKRKKKHPMKYGRSNGVMRGKKKKKKKALLKLKLLGYFLKGKIELLLKLLGTHLQIKFLAIALIGLMVNIARFWIDVKHPPHKVVYVEHGHHQHHYDSHDDDWIETAGGGYWKRSLQTDSTENVHDSVTNSYQQKSSGNIYHALQQYHQYDPQYLAYENQWQEN